jgi:hypothetical protein
MPSKSMRQELLSQMTEILVRHLETMPPDERAERVAAFRQTVTAETSRPQPPVR